MQNITKIMWAYMFRFGGHGTPSKYSQTIRLYPAHDTIPALIKKHGIDWKKTKEPSSDTYSVFDGTDCDPDSREGLCGNLVLKNGKTFEWWFVDSSINHMLRVMEELKVEVETNPIYKD